MEAVVCGCGVRRTSQQQAGQREAVERRRLEKQAADAYQELNERPLDELFRTQLSAHDQQLRVEMLTPDHIRRRLRETSDSWRW